LSPECVDALRTFASNPDKTRGNILSTFRTPLAIFRDPRLAAATSGDDFDLRDVRRKKMSIYIGMTPEDLLKYNALMNVFFSQLLNENTRVLPEHDPSLKYQCLLLLDEFPALGRIGIIEKAVGYMAGYNMRLVLIYQNKGQLIGQDGQGYGDRGIKMLYQPEDEEDAEEYSKALGTQTVKARSRSRGTGRGGGSTNTTDSDQRRPLMLPQELKEMGLDKVIITSKLCKPIFADKIMYFKDDELKDRADLPTPPVPRMEIVRLQHRTRLLTVSEVATVKADDIANKAEILAAVGKAIGFDFSAFVVAAPAAPADQVNVAKAA
jgi:type IV secretion system protein VirD4